MGMTEQDILAQVEKGLGETNRRLGEIADLLRQLTAALRSVARPARPTPGPHRVPKLTGRPGHSSSPTRRVSATTLRGAHPGRR